VQINWGHPIANKLVGAWVFNEGAGRSVQDLAYKQGVSTWNSATWGASAMGIGLALNGSQDVLISRRGAYVPTTTSRASVFCLVSPTSFTTASGLVCLGQVTDSNWNQTLCLNVTTGAVGYSINGGLADGFSTFSSFTTTLNALNAVAYVERSATDRTFLCNGRLEVNTTNLGGGTTTGGLAIGRGYKNSTAQANGLVGQIGCVYIWDRALSNTELLMLNAAPYALLLAQRPRVTCFLPTEAVATSVLRLMMLGMGR
jgi:hypothetical protein